VKIAESVGGYGEQVTDPEKLQDAPKRGLEANRSGKPAIIDVIVTSMMRRAVVPALEPSFTRFIRNRNSEPSGAEVRRELVLSDRICGDV
jgi:hypothetical protein